MEVYEIKEGMESVLICLKETIYKPNNNRVQRVEEEVIISARQPNMSKVY